MEYAEYFCENVLKVLLPIVSIIQNSHIFILPKVGRKRVDKPPDHFGYCHPMTRGRLLCQPGK